MKRTEAVGLKMPRAGVPLATSPLHREVRPRHADAVDRLRNELVIYAWR
jgi:hypothetical protein